MIKRIIVYVLLLFSYQIFPLENEDSYAKLLDEYRKKELNYENQLSEYKTYFKIKSQEKLPSDIEKTIEKSLKSSCLNVKNLSFEGNLRSIQKTGRTIEIYVIYQDFYVKGQVAQEGEMSYLLEKKRIRNIDITIKLKSISGSEIYSYRKKFFPGSKEIAKYFDDFADSISKFYPDLNKPVMPEKPQPKQHTSREIEYFWSIHLYSGHSFGAFQNICGNIFGIGGQIRAEGFFDFPIYGSADFSIMYGLSNNKKIDTYFFFPLSGGAGYVFRKDKKMSIFAETGGGYVCHYINGRDIYFDPFIYFSAGPIYNWDENLKFALKVKYNLFFEHTENGSFMGCYFMMERHF